MIPRLPLLLLALSACSTAATEAEFDQAWEIQAATVNEGKLHFLTQPPNRPVHLHHNRIIISESSLREGWVYLRQCHGHLDPVPALQITYHPSRIRDLRISAHQDIGKAWVDGPSIQLTDVGKQAQICITARSRALHRLPDDSYELRTGPYMRRFLDGYYPMHLELEISYPSDVLCFAYQQPLPTVKHSQLSGMRIIRAHAWFEGRLNSVFHFYPSQQNPCPDGLE